MSWLLLTLILSMHGSTMKQSFYIYQKANHFGGGRVGVGVGAHTMLPFPGSTLVDGT